MYSVIKTAVVCGFESLPVQVETDVSDGMPTFDMVGFLTSEVKEARERVRTALKNAGFRLPVKKITINLTPADVRKSGTGCDLPMAASVLAAFGFLDEHILSKYLLLGEVGLNGSILPTKGVLSAAVLAQKEGMQGIVVPWENAREAAILDTVKVIPVKNLKEFVQICQQELPETCFYREQQEIWKTEYDVDFAELRGQPMLRRACEIAVSGMHNLLMMGPPGSGKTMAAKRIPTILPELSREEKLELSQIYSLCGLLDQDRIIQNERPFRSPHHTVTAQALVGGGKQPHPGEISLAHHGILFLDELAEFKPGILDVLREPLEEKKVHISRVGGRFVYPADFMLVASTNPCPCGFYPNLDRCNCRPQAIKNYISRISQAFLNRIDLCVETEEVLYTTMVDMREEESSAVIRARVERVHEIQRERFKGRKYRFNSQMNMEDLETFCALDEESAERMQDKYEEYHLSARTYGKILKTARTIADMEGEEKIQWGHLEEAFFFPKSRQELLEEGLSMCDLKYDFWLASLTNINSSKRIQVRELCGSAQDVYELREETLKNMHLFTDNELQHLLESQRKDLNRAWERFIEQNIQMLPIGSKKYPQRLKDIAQPPYAIFCKGSMPDARKSVAIVGARMCSEYGRSIATKLGRMLAGKDVQVISGMAIGIDSASHAGALQGKGSTFAVLGCGCDICYPKNAHNLYENIQTSGGGILSEYPPGTEPLPYRFPERNRIISALSDCLVVVEAKKKSGSLITADAALEQGKDVYAVPGRFGDALSEGCNALIGQGAGIIYDLDVFLQNLGYLPEKNAETTKIKNISLDKSEQLVYGCLGLHSRYINYIIEETGLDLFTVLRSLDKLKRCGLVQETFQNYFCKRI